MTSPKLSAESYRLRALAFLMSEDLAQARLEIRKALEMEPTWTSIRSTAAMIDYYSALAAPALPHQLVPWPEPVDWSLVKRDNDSLTRLRDAARVFDQLTSGLEVGSEVKQIFETWRVACLACDPEKQEEARSYCQSVLLDFPPHFRVLMWVVARGYEIDLLPSANALEDRMGEDLGSPGQILGLISCYLASNEVGKALELLDQKKYMFEEYEANALWVSWRVQILVRLGREQDALEILDAQGEDSQFREGRTLALVAIANKTGNWEPAIEHSQLCYEETKDTHFLLQACEFSAHIGNWAYVAQHSKSLVESIRTPESIKLAAVAAFNMGYFDLCLGLIDENLAVFRDQTLPSELRRIRALCLQALGALPDAVVELERLFLDEPSVETILALAQIYLEKGEFKGLALLSRKVEAREDIPVEAYIRLARTVQWEDVDLAKSLWRKAKEKGIPENLIAEALVLGYQLALDTELGSLTTRMQAMGSRGEGGIQLKSVDDLSTLIKAHKDHVTQMEGLYKRGNAPIHAIAANLNISPAYLFRGVMASNAQEPDPLKQPYILIRHGGRGLIGEFSEQVNTDLHLVVDVTALLIAEHLRILPHVERSLAPIQIPQTTVASLIWMREALTFHQPSRVENYEHILNLVESGALKVVQSETGLQYDEERHSILDKAGSTSGFVVDYLPLRQVTESGPHLSMPDDSKNHIVNMHAVIQALRNEGQISEIQFEAELMDLGTEGEVPITETLPTAGSKLYLMGNIPEELARIGVLRKISECFETFITSSELVRIRTEIQQLSDMSLVANWLDDLIGKLSRGIDARIFLLLPRTSGFQEEKAETETNPLLASLHELLSFDVKPGHVIWSDDRYVNSYSRRDAAPIVGVNEILKILVGRGEISLHEYFSLIGELRKGNARFIPVTKDEIIHYLMQAKVENNQLIETHELAVLRRSIAACLIQGELLQRPPMPENAPNQYGEISYGIGIVRSIIEAIIEVWTICDDKQDRFARLEWLLANMYIDHLAMYQSMLIERPPADEIFLVGTTLASFISQAITIPTAPEKEGVSLRKEYFTWLNFRLLQERIDADPQIIHSIAEIIKRSLLESHAQSIEEGNGIPVSLVLQTFIQDLPEPVRQDVSRDTDFMATIGFRSIINANDLEFEPSEFWEAASQAINGKKAHLVPLNEESEVEFKPYEDTHEAFLFCIKELGTDEEHVVSGDTLGLLVDSTSEREGFLRQKDYWFDTSGEDFDRLVAELASIEDPYMRITEAEAWRDSSASVFYERLSKRFNKSHSFEIKELRPPNGDALLRYFGFPELAEGDKPFTSLVEYAYQDLLERIGIEGALKRLAGIPIRLPKNILDNLSRTTPGNREATIRYLLANNSSPFSDFRLIELLSNFISDSPAYSRLCRKRVAKLLDPENVDKLSAIISILKFVFDDFARWADTREWPFTIRISLAWLHTDTIFSLLSQAGASPRWIMNIFGELGRRVPLGMFEFDPTIELDVSYHRMVTPYALILGSIGDSLADTAELVLDQHLREEITEVVFSDVNGQAYPNFELLRDPTQAQNSLGSYLGDDRGKIFTPLIGKEKAAPFFRESLVASAQRAISELQNSEKNLRPWGELYAILGALPPYDSVVKELREVIRKADFVALCGLDPMWGLLALQVATLQFANYSEKGMRTHLLQQFADLALMFDTKGLGSVDALPPERIRLETAQDVQALLIEAALNISRACADTESEYSMSIFRESVSQMTDSWDSMRDITWAIVQRLIEGLPIRETKDLWQMVLELRAF